MTELNNFLTFINSYLWGAPMIILLLGTHLYLTIRLRFPQRYIFKAIRLSLQRDKGSTGDVSQFSALATSLAGTIGTGNIIGVATAVTMGGPGAVFWCWMTGVLGISTKYAEGLLAIKYRVHTSDGKMLGGPMYALERGLGCRWLGLIFAFCTVVASFFIGNMIQCNSISMMLNEGYHIPPLATGITIALTTCAVIMFGVKGIAKVCEGLVPFMALFYIGGCLWILGVNHSFIWPALKVIVTDAFNPQAATGGFVGSTIMTAMRYGIARGLFSNESGLGSAPIVAAAARTRNPVRQAMVSSTSPFWDTVVICAITGLVLVSSIMADPSIDSTAGARLTKVAFGQIPTFGPFVLTMGIVTFSFSTILGWSYLGEKALEYIFGRKARYVYRVLWITATFIGAITAINLVWNLGDTFNALMAFPNILSVLLLTGVVVKETRHYLWEKRLDEEWKEE
uniref:alanine/glycine:cation symporter family protein n=1 Tax=Alloprevotella sp. TaxID=1872471 RepID=UPI003FD7AD2D